MKTQLELWGGIESTINRVGDQFFDQFAFSGHLERLDDLDRLKDLDLKTVRYPVHWERVCPDRPDRFDWSWIDQRMNRLKELGIEPIVGLLHHGSGPRYTSLVDDKFPEMLAEFAAAVARRYPWVRRFTPVNEPLTTARFSGLYGVWYPHGKDDRTMLKALLTELRGTVLAMRAIRSVIPDAQLIQTEDMGQTSSTPRLAYQADFENRRRWLSLDFLTGRVNDGHPLLRFLVKNGMTMEDVAWFQENRCPPDVVGINHYLTSNRYLDERVDRYPVVCHGGNGRHAYADIEAVRVGGVELVSRKSLLKQTWDRYGLPLAVTECHLGCSRDEQMRWLLEAWKGAEELRDEGVDLRAVAVWSLFGVYYWNCLVTRCEGLYEPGAFDVRGPAPRETAIASMIRSLTAGGRPDHPALESPGWWTRPNRFLYPRAQRRETEFDLRRSPDLAGRRPLLLTGGTGTLGQAFARICQIRGLPHALLTRKEMDIADRASVERIIERLNPWAVINAAGFVDVDRAESEAERCFRENVTGPETLARALAAHGVPFVTFSSDLVFDGASDDPYVESSPTRPLNQYGRSKAIAEEKVLAIHRASLVVRASAFFGPWDPHNFVAKVFEAGEAGSQFYAFSDATVSPTYVPDLVHATLDLLIDGETGIRHLANDGAVTWLEFARHAARLGGLDDEFIEGRTRREMDLPAERPANSVLRSERGIVMPTLDDALARYITDRSPHQPRAHAAHLAAMLGIRERV